MNENENMNSGKFFRGDENALKDGFLDHRLYKIVDRELMQL